MKRRVPNPQRQLFAAPAEATKDETPVTLPMREISPGTDKAWHIAPLGVSSGKAAFAARSLVTRGVGDQASQFTMPKWLARERGWL